jgi:hypothetical protein
MYSFSVKLYFWQKIFSSSLRKRFGSLGPVGFDSKKEERRSESCEGGVSRAGVGR